VVGLLDVNVLVALFVTDHEHHELALDWFATHAATGGVLPEVRSASKAKYVTDRYLLGLARRNGGQLVTFDRQLAADGGHDVVCLLPEPV
jgi:predicted nucleic acid-binding protein